MCFCFQVPNASSPGISFILRIQVLRQDRLPWLCLNSCRNERVERYLWFKRSSTVLSRTHKSICIETFSAWLCKCGTYRRKTTSRVKYREVLRLRLSRVFFPSLPCFLSPAGDRFAQCTHCVFHSRMLCQTESLHCWLFHAVKKEKKILVISSWMPHAVQIRASKSVYKVKKTWVSVPLSWSQMVLSPLSSPGALVMDIIFHACSL